MLRGDNRRVVKVHGLDQSDLVRIKDFLQGAVYSWCNTHQKGEWFCASDLIGGGNSSWDHCPLEVLYRRHIRDGYDHDYAFDQAAKDAGKILKSVLDQDQRVFETESGYTRRYRWIG